MAADWDEGAWNSAVISFSGRYGEERARGGASSGGWQHDWAQGTQICNDNDIPVSDAKAEARRRVDANWGGICAEADSL